MSALTSGRRQFMAYSLLSPIQTIASSSPPFVWPAIDLIDGRQWRPGDWKGTAAVMVVFATWCPFCARHNAHIEALYRKTLSQPVRVFGAALDQTAESVKNYMRERNFSFPVTLQGAQLQALVTDRKVIPMTFTVSRTGQPGVPIPGEMFAEDVAALASG